MFNYCFKNFKTFKKKHDIIQLILNKDEKMKRIKKNEMILFFIS